MPNPAVFILDHCFGAKINVTNSLHSFMSKKPLHRKSSDTTMLFRFSLSLSLSLPELRTRVVVIENRKPVLVQKLFYVL